MKLIFAALTLALLGGCATPVPLNEITIGGAPSVTSDRRAQVAHTTATVEASRGAVLIPVAGMFVPISIETSPEFEFHSEDQAVFAGVLCSELLRLKVFKSVTPADVEGAPDFKIMVNFVKTSHQMNRMEFVLDVVMTIGGGKTIFSKQYLVNSNENASNWEVANTGWPVAKGKAIKVLLGKLIPDIQAYVRDNS